MYLNFNFNKKIKYIIYFIIGLILGLSLSSVNALAETTSGTITYTDTSLNMTSSNYSSEEYIYKIFNYVVEQTNLNISFEDFKNVFAFNYKKGSSDGNYFFATDDWYYYSNSDNNKYAATIGDVLWIRYNPKSIGSKTFYYAYFKNEDSSVYTTNFSGGDSYYVFSTHDFTGKTKFLKVLDFSSYLDKTMLSINVYDKNSKLINAKICKKSDFDNGSFCGLTFDSKNAFYLNADYHIKSYEDNYSIRANTYNNLNFDVINGLSEDKIFSIKFGYYDTDNTYKEYIPKKMWVEKNFKEELVNYDINFYSDVEIPIISNIIITFNFKDRIINSMYFKKDLTLIENNNFDESNATETILNNSINDLNQSISDTNINGASGSAGDFFNSFEDNDYGLSDIITIPLNLIKSCTSTNCQTLNLQIPFLENKTLTLPCMRDIYENFFGSFLTIYQTITFGIVSYWVCVNIYSTVKGFKDPDNDKIEVLDL